MKKLPGFTLIELLIVIAIMATLAVAILPQLNRYNQNQALQIEALRLQTALRAAQNNAGSGLKCNSGAKNTNWYLSFVSLSNNTYTLRATCADNSMTTYVSYTIPPGVKLSTISAGGCSIPINGLASGFLAAISIMFNNISADVTFNVAYYSGCPSFTNADKLVITLTQADNAENLKKVVVKKGGSIYLSSDPNEQ
ncbi:type II secretion system protein [Candidatus Daviesbacteria bacterium]|nr:type II secretion system protein [Candidatus Daviesbacteria bacterium]